MRQRLWRCEGCAAESVYGDGWIQTGGSVKYSTLIPKKIVTASWCPACVQDKTYLREGKTGVEVMRILRDRHV